MFLYASIAFINPTAKVLDEPSPEDSGASEKVDISIASLILKNFNVSLIIGCFISLTLLHCSYLLQRILYLKSVIFICFLTMTYRYLLIPMLKTLPNLFFL